MHSKDPAKQTGELFDKFWQEFEAVLARAGDNVADFEKFIFPKTDLQREINAVCSFNHTVFSGNADFTSVTFNRGAQFYSATFSQDANFTQTIFKDTASFLDATFEQEAFFIGTTFEGYANFQFAKFKKNAGFIQTKFFGVADWSASDFYESAKFSNVVFTPQFFAASAAFVGVMFFQPNKVLFADVNLSSALFRSCDVSEVLFTSSVRWGQREGDRGLIVFDESVEVKDGGRDYEAIAQIYRQLKKNYDTRLDYWTADKFHFGEMEMQRLAVPTRGHLLKVRQWWHSRASLVAWYRHASDYGNSFIRPLFWLVALLLLFALAFPLPGIGLQRNNASYCETYASVWQAGSSVRQSLRWEAGLIGKSLLAAVDTATFQKSPEYNPTYPIGRVLTISETLLTSTLFALFLLAIRRQFRR